MSTVEMVGAPRRGRDLRLVWRQLRSENRAFWRNPAAAFFTFLFPLIFMVIFNLLFGGKVIVNGVKVNGSTFYTPAITALSLIGACFTNIAMGVVFARDEGVLKRVRGTPLPSWTYLAGRILNAVAIGLLLVVIVCAFGRGVYGASLPGRTMPAFLVAVLTGCACFTALGLAVTAIVPNADAAPPMINGIILPLLFISDVFIPLDHAPGWLKTLSGIFPVKHLTNSLLHSFVPRGGSGFVVTDLVVLVAWGALGAFVASRTFRWEPKRY